LICMQDSRCRSGANRIDFTLPQGDPESKDFPNQVSQLPVG